MKKRSIEKVILIIFLGLSLSIVGISQEIENPGVMLRSAIEKEEVDGDLLGAIELYQQIIEKFSTNQAIAAKAQLRIGLCYEKLGQKNSKQALDAYQKVINNYPLQSEEVKAANEKLSRLLKTETVISKENKEDFVIRKVIDSTGAGFEGGKPSPDGNKFVFTDWDSGNLAVYESATGKKRPLTSQASWEEDHIQYVENSTWSPDGTQIVYDWYNENGVIELRIIGLDGLTPRILYKPNKEVIWAQTFDWSNDGKQILACFQNKDETRQIVLVSAENGTIRVLKTLVGKNWMHNMSFSPDGRYIVYDFPPEEFSQNHDIYLMSTNGDPEISLIEHPAYDYVLGWASDGNNILFVSDRTGNFDAFVIQVANGKPQSVPKVIKSDIGILTPKGFTQKGSFYYSTRKGGNNVYTADLDPETDNSLSLPKKIIKRFEGSNFYPYYSLDGKYMAYLSIRIRRGIICIHNLETGVDREFSLTPFNIHRGRGFRWFPDGSSILARGIDNKRHHGIFRLNLHTGNITPIIPWENWRSTFVHSVELSRDGKTVFYVDFDTTNDWSYNNLSQIMVRDLDTGAEQELYRVNNYTNISLSPDGKWLASSHPKSLKVMPATGGEAKDLYKFKEESNSERPITWSADGKFILFSRKKSGQDGWELCRISAEGGDPQKLGLEMEDGFMNLSVHPSGRNIVFSTSEQANAEFWVMENFLPKTKDKNKSAKGRLMGTARFRALPFSLQQGESKKPPKLNLISTFTTLAYSIMTLLISYVGGIDILICSLYCFLKTINNGL